MALVVDAMHQDFNAQRVSSEFSFRSLGARLQMLIAALSAGHMLLQYILYLNLLM